LLIILKFDRSKPRGWSQYDTTVTRVRYDYDGQRRSATDYIRRPTRVYDSFQRSPKDYGCDAIWRNKMEYDELRCAI